MCAVHKPLCVGYHFLSFVKCGHWDAPDFCAVKLLKMAQLKLSTLSQSELLSITESPGAQYLVLDAQDVLMECYAGLADLESKTPVTAQTTFNAFSITKTATAAAVLKLVEQGRIGLEAYMNPLFREFHFSHPFTLRQLLSHQAGFSNPIPISWVHLAAEDDAFDERKFSINLIDRHSEQKFKPGTKAAYSSIGYLLLAQIIEQVSGESYESYVRKNVLPALEETDTLDFRIENHERQAVGYHKRFSFSNLLLECFLDRKKYIKGQYGSWTAFQPFYVNGKAYGGLLGNARGLAAYLRAYLNQSIFLHPETQQMMFAEQKGGLSLGWYTGKLHGEKFVCHAGGGGGYYAEIRIYPELNIASVLLRNRSGFSDLRLLDKIDSTSIFSTKLFKQ